MGVALSVCTLPGQVTSDRLGPGLMELGLGIVSGLQHILYLYTVTRILFLFSELVYVVSLLCHCPVFLLEIWIKSYGHFCFFCFFIYNSGLKRPNFAVHFFAKARKRLIF